MSNPGNKRRHRALAGAAPSTNLQDSDNGIAQNDISDRNGLFTVQRTKGSVINHGGNMMQGTFPTVGVSVPFLMKLGMCCSNGKVSTSAARKD